MTELCYDQPDVDYDAGWTYQDDPAPTFKTNKMEKRVKLALAKKTPDQKVTLGNTLHTGLTGNLDFPSPKPDLPTYAATVANLKAKHEAFLTVTEQAKSAREARKDALALFDTQTTQLAAYAEAACNGDPVKLEAAGFAVRKTPEPNGELALVTDLQLKPGKHDGTLKAKWKPTRGAAAYDLQICPDPITEANWRNLAPSSRSRATLRELASGTKLWLRVRAIGKGSAGPWSNPSVKIVP